MQSDSEGANSGDNKDNKEKWVSHYTDAGGLQGILSGQTGPSIRATDSRFLNDASEIIYIYESLEERIQAYEIPAESLELASRGNPGTFNLQAPEDQAARRNHLITQMKKDGLLPKRPDKIYLACFSKEADLLSQWRAYAHGRQGYSLQFDRDAFLPPPGPAPAPDLYSLTPDPPGRDWRWRMKDVDYQHPEVIQQRFDSWLSSLLLLPGHHYGVPMPVQDKVLMQGLAPHRLAEIAENVKNPAFKDENEVRLIVTRAKQNTYLGASWADPVTEGQKGFVSDLLYREGRHSLIPFRLVTFEPHGLRQITVGPGSHQKLAVDALRERLNETPFDHVEVVKSKVPFRSDW